MIYSFKTKAKTARQSTVMCGKPIKMIIVSDSIPVTGFVKDRLMEDLEQLEDTTLRGFDLAYQFSDNHSVGIDNSDVLKQMALNTAQAERLRERIDAVAKGWLPLTSDVEWLKEITSHDTRRSLLCNYRYYKQS